MANNLIPINIKDLPKLNVLSNTDLIPIETVQGTATILYRDFIIDEEHTTFGATLSASVTSAVNLSAAIDSTNSTVRTVSATLNSSITALSSFSYTSIATLSSNVNSLSSSIATLSANQQSLSAHITTNTTDITNNTTNIASLSTTVASITSVGITSTGPIVGSNSSIHYVLSANRLASLAAADNFFNPGDISITLLANKKYLLQYNIFYTKTTAGTMTFTLCGTQTYANAAGRFTHTPLAGLQTTGTIVGGGAVAATSSEVTLPATGSLTTGVNHNAMINFVIENSSNINYVKLVADPSAGTFTPLRGSSFTLTPVN